MTSRWMYTYIHTALPAHRQRSTYLDRNTNILKVLSLKSVAVGAVVPQAKPKLEGCFSSEIETAEQACKLIAQMQWKLIGQFEWVEVKVRTYFCQMIWLQDFCNLVRVINTTMHWMSLIWWGVLLQLVHSICAVSINATLARAQLGGLPPQLYESSSWSNHT